MKHNLETKQIPRNLSPVISMLKSVKPQANELMIWVILQAESNTKNKELMEEGEQHENDDEETASQAQQRAEVEQSRKDLEQVESERLRIEAEQLEAQKKAQDNKNAAASRAVQQPPNKIPRKSAIGNHTQSREELQASREMSDGEADDWLAYENSRRKNNRQQTTPPTNRFMRSGVFTQQDMTHIGLGTFQPVPGELDDFDDFDLNSPSKRTAPVVHSTANGHAGRRSQHVNTPAVGAQIGMYDHQLNNSSYVFQTRKSIRMEPMPSNIPEKDKLLAWKNWLYTLELNFQKHGISEQYQMALELQLLAGLEVAKVVLVNRLWTPTADPDPDWPYYSMLKRKITKHFATLTNSQVLTMEYLAIQQNSGETIHEYAQRVKLMGDRLFEYNETLVTGVFLKGLRDKTLKERALTYGWSIEKTVQTAMRSAALRISGKTWGEEEGPSCTVAEVSRSSGAASAYETKRPMQRQQFNKPRYERSELPDSKAKACSNCGWDHGSDKRCPAAGKKCFECGRLGHWGRMCRAKGNTREGSKTNDRDSHTKKPTKKDYSGGKTIREVETSYSPEQVKQNSDSE
jgi:hypothetical protein